MTEHVVERIGVKRDSPLFEPTVITMLDEAMRATEFGARGANGLRRSVNEVIEQDLNVDSNELTDIMAEVTETHAKQYTREGLDENEANHFAYLTMALFLFRLGVQVERRRRGGEVHRDDTQG
jgi:hypothetical protein